MNVLDTSSITDASEFPIKQGTLVFLQQAYSQIVAAVMQALLSPSYNPSTVYVLYGVVNAGSAPFYNITAGAVFYQGEIFLVPAASFTATGSNVGVFQIVTTQFTTNADPVTFTDMTIRNVHNIRQIQVVQGASGSGIADYTAAFYCSFVIPKQLNLSGTGQASVSGVYPNMVVNVPNNGNLCPVLTDGSVHVGDVPGGGVAGVTIPITFMSGGVPTPISTASYRLEGTMVSQGTPQNDSSCIWTLIDSSRTVNGCSVHFREAISDSQALSFEYIVFQKNNP
jgi:hypothetical protein